MADAKVSLCVIRLEIRDDESFNAFEFAGDSTASSPSTASSHAVDSAGNKDRLSSYEINRHRGERARRSIEVEIFDFDGEMSQQKTASGTDTTATTKRSFFSGNPFVEVTEGILHLYKEDKSSPAPGGPSSEQKGGRSEMVCMLAVPAVLTSRDLLNFVAPCSPDIKNVRIVRDKTPNQYMVLLRFR
jgi:BRCA1-associated protein